MPACIFPNQLREDDPKVFKTKALLETGDFKRALVALETALHECGPHVGLLADIAACAYQLQDVLYWRRRNEAVVEELTKCRELLCNASLIRTLVCIGKFLEEEGRIAKAAIHSHEAADVAQQDALRWWAWVQGVRLQAQFALDGSMLCWLPNFHYV